MVNMMLAIAIQKTWYTDEVEQSETVSHYLVYELTDGRFAPVASGGLVELAINELGAELVDYAADPVSGPEPGLN